MILRLKHSTGTVLAAWRALSECHHIYDPRIQNPPVCDAPGDQNHRSIPLWEQPAVQWCTESMSFICRHVLARLGFLGVLAWQAEFRILLEHFRQFFFYLRCTFLRTYNVHCDAYSLKFILFLFFLDSGRWAWAIWILIKPTTGGFLILKLLLCTGGVTAKERIALSHSF